MATMCFEKYITSREQLNDRLATVQYQTHLAREIGTVIIHTKIQKLKIAQGLREIQPWERTRIGGEGNGCRPVIVGNLGGGDTWWEN